VSFYGGDGVRTNTWLGLILFNQLVDGLADDRRARQATEQREQLARDQADRDQIRDEKFDNAVSLFNRGQFAMWIQTGDGRTFEQWTDHALVASRALDDRQDAWELAWKDAIEAARLRALIHRGLKKQIYVRERYTPPSAKSESDPTIKGYNKCCCGSVLAVLLSVALLGVLVTVVPESDGRPLAIAFYYFLMFVVLGGSLGAIVSFLAGAGRAARLKELLPPTREQLAADFDRENPGLPEAARIPSWHAMFTPTDVRALSLRITNTAEGAHEIFPREAQLPSLSEVYATRTSVPEVPGVVTPEVAALLLEGFQTEDKQRIEALQHSGLR
jgi:hypothetical protein